MTEKNPPIKEFCAGSVVAAIWRETTPSDDRRYPPYVVRIQKRYRDDKTGDWKTTVYFRPDELSKLVLVVSKAFEFLALSESGPDTMAKPS